jgi:putative transposase
MYMYDYNTLHETHRHFLDCRAAQEAIRTQGQNRRPRGGANPPRHRRIPQGNEVIHRAFKYRLFTNANQERELAAALETHRRLYNFCLEWKQHAWQCVGASMNYIDFSRWFREERKVNPYYARLNVGSARQTMRRCDKAFDNFFRRIKEFSAKPGYPRFKGKIFFDSVEFTYRNGPGGPDGIKLAGNRLYVQHIGTIRVKLHRPVEGNIKTVTLKREGGKWFAIFSCELPDVPATSSNLPSIGIDVGLTHFLTDSNGRQEENPRYLKGALPELRRAERSKSRKKLGGTNRKKAVVKLKKIHAHVANSRREHHYQVACRLVLAFGLIVVERLNIVAMVKNGKFSRAISDVAWGGFLNILQHKANKAGAQFVAVDPKGTSQQCTCGQEVKKTLFDRWHECPACGLSQDRDHVSAQVILARGLAARAAPPEPNVGHKVKRVPRSRRLRATV